MPHPLALFSLGPVEKCERAKHAIAHPDNAHLVSRGSKGTPVLDVGFHIRGKSSTTLATLGRGVEADIYLEGPSIAKVQCSFEIDLDTGVVMFFDRSHGCTSQVSGENAAPFEQGRVRKVLVQANVNTVIGMGGERRDLFQFELEWHQTQSQAVNVIKQHNILPWGRLANPRAARTIDVAPTDLVTQRQTRIHTSGQQQPKIRYALLEPELGSGQFGTVYKAVDVDSGKLMAVKILKQPMGAYNQEEWRKSYKREVKNLSQSQHPHIVDYIASQGWDEEKVKIFMGLKEGTLASLIQSGADLCAVADRAFPHMLQALDFIACKGIIHRDLKPENILYYSQPDGRYCFQLGDFGLCNRVVDAVSTAGSFLYMAPEIFGQGIQTHKVDVWSLFVTILWTLDAGEFRQMSNRFKSTAEVQEAVVSIALNAWIVSKIREMAMVDPKERATAAQMLVEHYAGEGLSTPRNRVPALTNCIPFSWRSPTIQHKPRGL